MKKNESVNAQNTVKRGPGRPRKNPEAVTETVTKRRPGRPKKSDDEKTKTNKKSDSADQQIPGQVSLFDDVSDMTPKLAVYGLAKISKSVKESTVTVTDPEARFLVDTYYQVQAARISAANQIRSIVQGADDNADKVPQALSWVFENMKSQEVQIKAMLDFYTSNKAVGYWLKEIIGIGPVLAAGLLSNFDFDKAPHYGNFVSFAGLNDYNNPWLGEKGSKKVVEEVYTELLEDDMELVKKFDIDPSEFLAVSKAMIKENKKNEKVYLDPEELLLEKLEEELYGMSDLIKSLDENPERKYDFLIRSFVNNVAVTDMVKIKVAAATNRTLKVINNGLDNQVRADKKAVCATKTHLQKYLAKPPYSTAAKQLMYLIGESFVKVSGNPNSLYGRLYKERKAYELKNNEEGAYADQAAKILETMNYDKSTESYKAYIEGKLPQAQIHRRSKRYACRMLLSHLHEAMYVDKFGEFPKEEVYPLAHLEHEDYIAPEVPYNVILDFNKNRK